jgi:hypothetical protein
VQNPFIEIEIMVRHTMHLLPKESP